MITAEHIREVLKDTLAGGAIFIVDISVKPGNKILVLADTEKGITIDECVMINRTIEQHFNRDEEDYELEVSSPGLGQPFKVIQQYAKNIGRQVEVILSNGEKFYGSLLAASNDNFVVETKEKVRHEGKKKAELEIKQHTFLLSEVKSTKVILNF
jgi:ribosome maturation factor RimP